MNEDEAISLFKCLSDRSRLRILKSLAMEDMYVERLAERLDLSAPTVSFHLKKLAEAGAVASYKSQYYTMYSLRREVFAANIMDILLQQSGDTELQARRDEQYRKKVLTAFFEYGKLRSIPAQRKKERIVLEEIAKSFEPGREYSEREVNILLADFYDDFCTLRRDLVAEGIVRRRSGIYSLCAPSENVSPQNKG